MAGLRARRPARYSRLVNWATVHGSRRGHAAPAADGMSFAAPIAFRHVAARKLRRRAGHHRKTGGLDREDRRDHGCKRGRRSRDRPRVRATRRERRAARSRSARAARHRMRSARVWRPGAADCRRRQRCGCARRGGRADRTRTRAARRVGQQRDGDRVRAIRRHLAGRLCARDGRHLPRLRVRHACRARTDGPAQPRHDRAGRLGARIPVDSVAGPVLRRETRDPRLYRRAALRAAACTQSCARDDGAIARDRHAAVRLGRIRAAACTASGRAGLCAGGGGRCDRARRAASVPRALGRLVVARGDRRERPCPRLLRPLSRADGRARPAARGAGRPAPVEPVGAGAGPACDARKWHR